MDQKIIFFTIVGMAAVTYVPRALPMLVLASRSIPESVMRWLSYVPVAVLSAMLAPALLLRDGSLDFGFDNLFLWAAVPAFLLAITTRSFFGTVALGMGLVAAGRFLFGG